VAGIAAGGGGGGGGGGVLQGIFFLNLQVTQRLAVKL
jgi:hypothetical protein